jgi:FHA domain
MQQPITSDQDLAPKFENQEGDRIAYEAASASNSHYVQLKCTNCAKTYRTGELICINCGFIFSAAGKTEKFDSQTLERPPRTRRIGELVNNDQKPIAFLIDSQLLTIPVSLIVIVGRRNGNLLDQQPDVDLTSFNALESGVSRRHIRLTRLNDLVRVADLGSLNGTYLNGFRLTPQQDRVLRNGDELLIAQLTMRVKY